MKYKYLIIIISVVFICLGGQVIAKYILNKNLDINIKSAQFYFEAEIENTALELNNNQSETNLTIKNNNGTNYNNYDITYKISLKENNKFILYVNDSKTENNEIVKVIKGEKLLNEVVSLKFILKEGVETGAEEKIEIVIESNSPYSKMINQTISILVDNVQPEITLTANTTDWTNQDVTLTGKSQDEGSGLVGYAWTDTDVEPTSWNNIQTTTSEITQTITLSENATKYFWAKDKVGNVNVKSIEITKIDKTAPSTPQILITNISITANKWEYTISVSGATDSNSKIKNYEYMLGSSASTSTGAAKVVSGTNNPDYTIKVRAQDNAGNYSEYSNVMVLNIRRLFIRQLYQALRGNGGGSESEIDGWENQTGNAANLVMGIFTSREAEQLYSNVEKEEMVERLYNGILGRTVDSSGKQTYLNKMTSDKWSDIKVNILRDLANSPEAQNIFSTRGLGAGTI